MFCAEELDWETIPDLFLPRLIFPGGGNRKEAILEPNMEVS
jgi:hypothetical protein